jgi:hypothetical protein
MQGKDVHVLHATELVHLVHLVHLDERYIVTGEYHDGMHLNL